MIISLINGYFVFTMLFFGLIFFLLSVSVQDEPEPEMTATCFLLSMILFTLGLVGFTFFKIAGMQLLLILPSI